MNDCRSRTASTDYADNHDQLGARPAPRGCRPTCTSAASRRASWRAAAARRRRRRLPPPARWRDFYHHVLCHFPRNAQVGVPGALPRLDQVELRREAFETWSQGQTGFPLVDAGMRQLLREGWMHNRARLVVGLVPDQGPRDRLALGRALVHAPADRRRRGQQQRQLAVDRVAWGWTPSRRSGGSTTRRATWSASTPTASTCAATCPSCATCPTSTWPSRGRCRPRSRRRRAA